MEVCDFGEPGADLDMFSITVFDADGKVVHENDDLLGGGNIQMHAC